MRLMTYPLIALAALAAACAHGSSTEDVIDNRGGSTPVGGSTSASGSSSGNGGSGGNPASSSTGPSATASSGSTTTSAGSPPTTCAQANGFVGCCQDNVAYFCKAGMSTVTAHQCTGGEVCGWDSSPMYYYCVSPPGGQDPSHQHPIACQ
jgi:hypothetical protein